MVSLKIFVYIFIFYEIIFVMCMLGFLEELGIILKINLSSIVLGIRLK